MISLTYIHMLLTGAEVWVLIEMAVVCLFLALDSNVISGLFLVSVQHYLKHLHVAVGRARNHTVNFT